MSHPLRTDSYGEQKLFGKAVKTFPTTISSLIRTAVGLMLIATRVAAIDPLPLELENAPLDVQAAWRDQMGRESERQKLQMGKEHYDKRLAFKQALMTHFQEEVAARRDTILKTTLPPAIDELGVVSNTTRNVVIALLLLTWLGYIVRRRLVNATSDE
jgi:hypothetical protein